MARKRKTKSMTFTELVRAVAACKISARNIEQALKAMGLSSLACLAKDPEKIGEFSTRIGV